MGRGADRRNKGLPAISSDDFSEPTLARVRAEQVYAIARFTPAIFVVNIWNVVVLVAALYGTSKEAAALGWAFVICSVSAYLYLRGAGVRERRPTRVSRAAARTIVGPPMSIIGSVLIILACLAASAFFSGSETALFRLRSHDLDPDKEGF